MKRIWLIALFVAVSLILVAGCEESATQRGGRTAVAGISEDRDAGENSEQMPSASLAKIKFEKLVHNFGEVGPGTRHKCEFAFRNDGDGTLHILNIETACGCTVPDLKKMAYESGESGILGVEYHAQTQPGNVNKHLYVVMDDKDNPRVTLTIRAKVVKRVDFKPEHIKLFLEKGDPGIQEITLESLDGKPFSIESIKSTADCITADFDPLAKATRFVLKAKVDSRKLKGNLNGHVNIALTHPECPAVSVPFEVLPRFTVVPPTIVVLDARPSEVVRRKISVLSNYKEAFEIDRIVSANGSVKMLSKAAIRDGRQLEIEITPPDSQSQVGYNRGDFSIRLNDGVELPIMYQIIYDDPGSNGT